MLWWFLGIGVAVVALLAVALGARPLLRWARTAEVRTARELFRRQREHLEAKFLAAAAASGKPRGLRWVGCEWDGDFTLARERATGKLAALVGVTIKFAAVEGSDMEGLPAVGNLRNASAVFFFDHGRWHTVGKAVFNLNPGEAIEHFGKQYERVEGA
jgi:hypothetical protein